METNKNSLLKSIWMTPVFVFLFLVLIFGVTFYFGGFGAMKLGSETERFIVTVGNTNPEIILKLNKEGFIKSEWAFNFALNWKGFQKNIEPGGYRISKSMDVWKIAEILMGNPYMKWITIPEGLRKEEIAEILGNKLGWSESIKKEWVEKETTLIKDYVEGVYFPDTYLIPVDEKPVDVAKRLQNKFQENFAPYSSDALKQNIKWSTVVKFASIIQREASGKSDMALISGILWNRLESGMPLQVDCSLQYARGNIGKGWWAEISVEDKKIKSPYNTYLNKGLPPTPISNPGLDSIKAVLYPDKTKCLFYLHDAKGVIHCGITYEEHIKNIKEHL